MTAVPITKAQQIIAKADVNDIVFSECTEVGLAFDVKSLDLIEKVALQKRVHICLHRMGAGCAFALAVIQESFVDQRIADGGDRNTGADIIGKEQDDLPQQRRVCDLLLPSAFFSLQNITNDHRRIDAIEERQRLFLFQPNISNAGHSSETHISVKNLAQLVAFTVLIKYLLAEPTEGALRFPNLEVVESKELSERKRQHFDFHTPSGEIGRILR